MDSACQQDHHTIVAHGAGDDEAVEYLMISEILRESLKYRKLKCIYDAADGVDHTSPEKQRKLSIRKRSPYLHDGSDT